MVFAIAHPSLIELQVGASRRPCVDAVQISIGVPERDDDQYALGVGREPDEPRSPHPGLRVRLERHQVDVVGDTFCLAWS
ncbi:MAG: hypothetical protein WBL05_02855 [Brooklawnia sp.]|uniref:hypothetical protein n=1 Tax=Brooklawnia sp. TaxID=2699740 RepID=UPI003C722470